MLYRVLFADGSMEIVDAENISEARTCARELYGSPIRKIIVDDGNVDLELDEGENPETDTDDEDIDESENPEDDEAE